MIDYEVSEDVARLSLGAGAGNAMSDAWIDRLTAILDDLEPRTDWRVLHLRSTERMFSAGFDLKIIVDRLATSAGPAEMSASTRRLAALFDRIESLDRVTLAEIGGAAVGGGLELALACDLRVAAAGAKLGLPEVNLGLLPGAGGTQRLARLCGQPLALRLILLGEIVSAESALQAGLVQWSVPAPDLPDFATSLARKLARQPAGALRLAKKAVRASWSDDGFAVESAGSRELMGLPDTPARVRAFFERSAVR